MWNKRGMLAREGLPGAVKLHSAACAISIADSFVGLQESMGLLHPWRGKILTQER